MSNKLAISLETNFSIYRFRFILMPLCISYRLVLWGNDSESTTREEKCLHFIHFKTPLNVQLSAVCNGKAVE
jgi:hypothetical protein